MQARMGRRGGPDEGDSGDGSGCGDGRDDAGGATHPSAAINDVIVQSHASGFVSTELSWPSTWTERRDSDRKRVFGLADWHRDGTLADYLAIEARTSRRFPVMWTSRWPGACRSRG